MKPRDPPDTRPVNPNDLLYEEAVGSATDEMIDRLKRFREARPDMLPKGMPREVVRFLAMDAVGAWHRKRAEQIRRVGVAHTFVEAFMTGKAWPELAATYDVYTDFMD